MNNFSHKLGLYHGRFQHIHLGHQRVIDKMLSECEKVIILVRDCPSNNKGQNPFNVLKRIELIKKIYNNDRIIFGFFLDLHDYPQTEQDYINWGDRIIPYCLFFAGELPDAVYGGAGQGLSLIYTNHDIKIKEVERDDITATLARTYLKDNNEVAWKKITDSSIHDYYLKLKSIINDIS